MDQVVKNMDIQYDVSLIEIIKISLICYVFTILIKEKHIFQFYGRLIKRLPWYLYNPLGGCFMCLTGEVLLWYYIITQPFNIIEMLFYPSCGIMLTLIYDKIYNWWLCE